MQKSQSHQQKYSFSDQLNDNIAGKTPYMVPLNRSIFLCGTVMFFSEIKMVSELDTKVEYILSDGEVYFPDSEFILYQVLIGVYISNLSYYTLNFPQLF
jgi:hypothetical protein